ncbi:MAG: AIR synthase family protein [Anaerolineae bacterium]
MAKVFPIGKLDMDLLMALLARYGSVNERVVVGPGIGEDAAVIDFGDRYLVAKTDPITFATDEIGWYAIHVNANDIAAMGAVPRWFLATILLPEGETDQQLVEGIFAQLSAACHELDISLCGGHTEITYGLDRPIVVGQMLGEVAKERLVTTAGAQAGDKVILTKGIAIEATSIMAREREGDLRSKYPQALIDRCKGFLHDPGLSVVREAEIAVATGRVHAMHDPTEGGLATGLYELARAAGVGLMVRKEAIPILPETAMLCREFGLDPLGVIASGSLLITVPSADSARVVAALERAGIAAAVIGRVWEVGRGVKLEVDGELVDLPWFERDEIAKLFE